MKIKIGDEVKILVGKDKGKTAKVEKVFPKTNLLQVAGVNIYKKHTKGKSKYPGGVIEKVMPIQAAKVAVICPDCKEPTRVGFKLDSKTKLRVCRKCNKVLEG